jgi:hypothetical protein
VIRLIRKNRFIIALLLLVAAIDLAFAIWNPMVTSRRFYKMISPKRSSTTTGSIRARYSTAIRR